MDGRWNGSLKQESFLGFAFAIVIFSLGNKPLLYASANIPKTGFSMDRQAWFMLRTYLNSVGATVGYFLIRNRARTMNIRKQMPRFVLSEVF